MKAKITLLVGAAAGYVLGTRAGRERYEQIKGQASSIWQNPKVQAKRNQAQDFAKDKAPEVQHKVADAASSATGAAKNKFGQDTSSTQTSQPNATAAGGLHL